MATKHLYLITLSCFDLITRSSSEEAGTQFFWILMRRSAVASRFGRTEYQLLLMKISWWDRNVKIRYQMFSCDLWMWLVSIYQPNESNCREIRQYLPWVLVLVTLEGVYGGPVLSTVTVQHKYNTESSITKEHFVTLSVRCFNHKHPLRVKILNELR